MRPPAGGAKGRGYWLLMNVAEREPFPVVSGDYTDTFVKTADGWRITTRGSVRGGIRGSAIRGGGYWTAALSPARRRS